MRAAIEIDPKLDTPGGQTNSRVLVAYATRFGSTRGVAQRIASTLIAAGQQVELRCCDAVDTIDVYTAVVLGSPVFNQHWLPDADRFTRRNREALATRPVWLFSVGTFADDKTLIGPLMRREPRNIRELTRVVHPLDYRVFAGVIDREQWPLPSRLLFHALGGRLGDNRDWSAIEQWAKSIGHTLERIRHRTERR